MLTSQLFAGDPLLEAIAENRPLAPGEAPARISHREHQNDPAVAKVQAALLVWDPAALPEHGADGLYDDETAAAVVRFKIEELAVPQGEALPDVGPRTVQRLDEILVAQQQPPAGQALRDAIRAVLTDPDSATVRTLLLEVAAGEQLTRAQLAQLMGTLIEP